MCAGIPYWLVIAPTTETHNLRMKETYHTGNNLYINPTYVVSVPEFSGNFHARSAAQETTVKNLLHNKHSGELSVKAKMRMKNSLNWLCASAKAKRVWCKRSNKSFWFKVSFLTLTVPPQKEKAVSPGQLKVLLHGWFMYAQKYFYLKNYVWKVESHSDGRLHVHITTDSFIHYKKLRDSWNGLLMRKGFLEWHKEKFGNYDPNSTDIHSVKDVRNLAAYISEYMAKKTDLSEGFTGRIWSCNYNLSAKNKCSVNISADELSRELRQFYSRKFRFKQIKARNKKTGIERNVAEMFFLSEGLWRELKGLKVYDAYNEKRFRIRNALPDIPPEYYEMNFDPMYNQKLNQCVTEKTTHSTGSMLCGLLPSSEQNLNVSAAVSNIGKQLLLEITTI